MATYLLFYDIKCFYKRSGYILRQFFVDKEARDGIGAMDIHFKEYGNIGKDAVQEREVPL